jgi:hypothetical protein
MRDRHAPQGLARRIKRRQLLQLIARDAQRREVRRAGWQAGAMARCICGGALLPRATTVPAASTCIITTSRRVE